MPNSAVSPVVREGDVLSGKFRVERVLGQGGMGVVVAALHLQLDQHVALKFMLPEALADREATQRFLREARAVARLRSDNIARVLDVGELDTGAPYIVMELLHGHDVSTLVEAGPLPIGQAVGIVMHACAGVAEAHAHGIIHRDLKPRNLFLTDDVEGKPLVKVLDFGVSKDLGEANGNTPQLTGTRMILGSPQYMSPEQLKSSRDVDARADVWSLGICLYELVTGQVPFAAGSIAELCVVVLSEEPKPMQALRPEVPPGLDAVVQKCLRKSAAERFGTVAELAAALEPFADAWAKPAAERARNVMRSSKSTPGAWPAPSAPAEALASAATIATGPTVATWDVGPPARKRRRMLPLALGATFVVLGIGGAVAFALSHYDHPAGPATSPSAVASLVMPPPPPPASAPPTYAPDSPPSSLASATPPLPTGGHVRVHVPPPARSTRATAATGTHAEDRLLLDRN